MIKRRVIIDQDHLTVLYKNAKNNNEKYGNLFTSIKDCSDNIFSVVSRKNISHYLLGVAGVGKSTYAMNELGGVYVNTLEELIDIFISSDEETEYIVINAEKPRKEITDQAKEIIILQAEEAVVTEQREKRGKKNTFTNFGRSRGATKGAGLSNSISKAICNELYSDKTKLAIMNTNKEWDILPISVYQITKITSESIVQMAGKFSPPHLGHTMMITIKDSKEKLLDVLHMGNNYEPMDKYIPQYTQVIISGNESLQGLKNHEKISLLRKIPGFDTVIFDHMIEFGGHYYLDCGQGKVIQVDTEHSIGVLGKDRLPQGFTAGYIDHEILQQFLSSYPRTPDSPTAPLRGMIAKGFKYFIRADDAYGKNGIELSSSAYREEILKDLPDYDLIASMFDSHIAPYITSPENIAVIKLRLQIQKSLSESLNVLVSQLETTYIKLYQDTYGVSDFFTKTKKENQKMKNFDLRLVSKTDPNRESKVALINEYRESISITTQQFKKTYHTITKNLHLELNNF